LDEKDQKSITFWNYFLSSKSYWFWVIIAFAIITSLIVILTSESEDPLIYIRYALGFVFVLFMPGYAFIKALFPKKELDNFERIALSIGMSLAIVPIFVLLLNYTPWGINTATVTISLLILTTIFAIVSIIREYQTKLDKQLNNQ